MKTMFLGMMHFQDEYNYDIHRVEKCDISYAMPDGEILPFCTFNVFPEIYRDKVQKQFSISQAEWQQSHPGWTYAKDKYVRDVRRIAGHTARTRRRTGAQGLLRPARERRQGPQRLSATGGKTAQAAREKGRLQHG